MLKTIKVNLELLEQMLYFWKASSEGEKVGEGYLADVAQRPEMAYVLGDGLDADGVRKVLSAITNRERMNEPTQPEWKFWNNNMWVMEDMGLLDSMVRPLKVLNVDALVGSLGASGGFPYEHAEVIFVPGTTETYCIDGNRLVINFFKVTADLYEEDKVTLDGLPVDQFIGQKLAEMA